jgi:hypothetical protein
MALALACMACNKKQPADTAGSAGSAIGSPDPGSNTTVDAAPAIDAPAVDAAGSGSGGDAPMANRGGNCPSLVLGATTTAAIKGKAVVLTISATDKDAIAAMQKRSDEISPHWLPLQEDKEAKAGGPVHDRQGTRGGTQGICPVYWERGGKANIKKVPKGLIITITPKDKPEDLKAIIDGRIAKAAEWVKANIKAGDRGNMGGVGGGTGEHGSTHSGSGDGKGKTR